MLKILSDKIISKDTSTKEILDILLENRNIKPEDRKEFVYPVLKEINLPNIDKAVKIIKTAIKNNKNILIYGDYDVDGITATAILWRTLSKLKANVTPFIPHREHDGYGFKADSFFRFQKEKNLNFDLIITVDNGIVADFSKISCDIIVTDHHLPSDKLPKVKALIHTLDLSGSGIAYVLASALDKSADISLAALGTVADCLPLIGANRQIVVEGLKLLNKSPNLAIEKLMEVANIAKHKLTAYDLGFVIGPRINATGRLADPTDSLRLLCCDDPKLLKQYAEILHSNNAKRQAIQTSAIDDCLPKADIKDKLLFFADKKYLPGIIGLIAGKLTEKYYKPSVIIAIDKEISKGSCRSIPEINIIEVLKKHKNLLLDVGGHKQAAGLSILTKNIEKFQKAITKTVNQLLKDISLEPITFVDAQIEPDAVTLKNINAINYLEPFGVGNSKPIFLLKNIKINSFRTVGSTKDHLQLKVGNNLSAIAFRQGKMEKHLKIGQTIDVLANLDINIWQNTSTPQLIIKEILL